MLPTLEVEENNFFQTKNYQYVFCQYYSSNHFVQDFRVIKNVVDHIEKIDFLLRYRRFADYLFKRKSCRLYFSDDALDIGSYDTVDKVCGDYLCIIVGIKDLEFEDYKSQSNRIAALSNLLYGSEFAFQLHHEVVVDLSKDQHIYHSNIVNVSKRESELGSDFVKCHNIPFSSFVTKPRMLELISLAQRQQDLMIRFSLLWLALEHQIGKGRDREKFCKNELKSCLINAEINRLRDIRNNYFHEAEATKIQPFDEYSIYSIIRLSCFGNGPLRDAAQNQFEKSLKIFAQTGDFGEYTLMRHSSTIAK